MTAGRIRSADKIGARAGKIINRYKVAKRFILDIGDDRLSWRHDQAAVNAEAALAGIYIIRTPVPATELDAPAAATPTEPGLCRTRLPAKQGMRMPGTEIPAVSPDQLAVRQPDVVLLFLADLLTELRAAFPEVEAAGGRWVDGETTS